MPLLAAQGAIQWLAADAATTVYTVSGLSFQPKAILFWWTGIQSATDAASEALNLHRGWGFATSTSNRRCVGTFSQDTAVTSNCGSVARNDAVACTTEGVVVSDGELDLNSITATGFTLIVDDAAPQNITVMWLAFGGSDITVALCGDIAEPAGTGPVNYTVTGFTADGANQVVFMAGVQSTAAVNTAFAESSTLSVGIATGTGATEQITLVGQSDDASTAMDCDGACFTGEIHGSIALAGAAVKNARASLSAWGENLFTLNWAEVAIIDRRNIFLAIKGGSWKAGSYTIEGQTSNATATVSALPFTPVGVFLMGRMTAVQASDTTTANDRMGFGSALSMARQSMGVLDEDATASSVCEINHAIEYDSVLCFPSTAGALLSAYDIDLMGPDSIRVIVDVNGGVTAEWHGYVIFGNVPVVLGVGGFSPRATQVPVARGWAA